MTLADRVVVMNRAWSSRSARRSEIYDRPANTFVAGFIGSPAMNLMDGTVDGGIFSGQNVGSRAFRPRAQGPVTLGFRAEDAAIAAGRRAARRPRLLVRAARRCDDGDDAGRRRAGVGQGRQGLSRRDRRSGAALVSPATATCSTPRPARGSARERAADPSAARSRASTRYRRRADQRRAMTSQEDHARTRRRR